MSQAPQLIVCRNVLKVDSLEALLIMIRRLVYPNRLADLSDIFQQSEKDLSKAYRCSNLAVLNCVWVDFYDEKILQVHLWPVQ